MERYVSDVQQSYEGEWVSERENQNWNNKNGREAKNLIIIGLKAESK